MWVQSAHSMAVSGVRRDFLRRRSHTPRKFVELAQRSGPSFVRIPPSAVFWSPAPCGWSGRPSAALPDWSFCGAQRLGKAATWCPQVVFCPQAQAWTRWQTGGDCNAIAGA